MEPDELVQRFPHLYHVADANAWPSIERLGLLSTTAVLDLFGIEGHERFRIESQRRPECVPVWHPVHGRVVIRDNKPLLESRLRTCLQDGLSPRDWYQMLNRRVFFWPTVARVQKLMAAAAYSDESKVLVQVSTERLVKGYADSITLSPMNSGATRPFAHPRGVRTFLPVSEYDYDYWRRRRSASTAVAEVAVDYAVPDTAGLVERVELVDAAGNRRLLWVPYGLK